MARQRRSRPTRSETDSMGTVTVPADAYWGAQTQRALENFDVSPLRAPATLIAALGMVKRAAAQANRDLRQIDRRRARGIVAAADEVARGHWDRQFPVDVFQTGSGTSWNMNANEVIARRANEVLGASGAAAVHPNDHVNRGQSSNCVIPTAIHIANRIAAEDLLAALLDMAGTLESRAAEMADVLKLGRTHLMDAVPMTLGQELSAWATQIHRGVRRIEQTLPSLEELALGGTAVGTGLNAHPRFAALAVARIARATGIAFVPAANPFEAIACRDAQVELMGAINTVAVSLMKIAIDLRLLASGPRSGLGELWLPPLQPGSSLMPGKVNPVMPEMMMQVAAHVMGKHLSVTVAGQHGPLQLNVMMPLLAWETISAIEVLSRAVRALDVRCLHGLTADPERSGRWVERSLALATPLALELGYERAARVAQRAHREDRTVREVVLAEGLLTRERADRVLDPRSMLGSAGTGARRAGRGAAARSRR